MAPMVPRTLAATGTFMVQSIQATVNSTLGRIFLHNYNDLEEEWQPTNKIVDLRFKYLQQFQYN